MVLVGDFFSQIGETSSQNGDRSKFCNFIVVVVVMAIDDGVDASFVVV